jgi:hypothetical protein
MKKLLTLMLFIGAGVFAGCNDTATNTQTARNTAPAEATPAPTQKPPAVPYPTVERISLEDAKKDFDAGTAVFIDTHSKAAYDSEHVKGAINVPVDAIEANLSKLPKGKKLIAYCS